MTPYSRTTHLLYLHGFRSSPQSAKARSVAARMADHLDVRFVCPQLPPSPAAAMAWVGDLTAGWPAATSAVIGSSLGGFYAAHLHETRSWRAVLLNPAVDPARDLAKYIGEQTAWHDPAERFYFEPCYIDELRALTHPAPLAEAARVLAVVCKGDEVLDWREMTARCAGGAVRLVEGGDHAISHFESAHLPAVMAFLGL